jgi:hypothetical protein
MTTLELWVIKIVLVLAMLAGVGYYGYTKGEAHQEAIYALAQLKANNAVVVKNEQVQTASDKEAKTQVVYKDRIVVKYQTVEKKVIEYEKTPASNVFLDPEFIRLHDIAASSNGELPITEPAPRANVGDTQFTTTGITTGEAIKVITDNYKNYYQCQLKVEGWKRFYSDVQTTVNKPAE